MSSGYIRGTHFGTIPMGDTVWAIYRNKPWPEPFSTKVSDGPLESRAWDKSEIAVLTMDRTPQIAVSESEVPIIWQAFDAIPNRRFGDAVSEFLAFRAGF